MSSLFYYSQAISSFLKKLEIMACDILEKEMGLKTYRRYFKFNHYRYPLNFLTFEKEKTLGYFDPQFLQIGIHRHFLFAKDQSLLINVLRHELVHYLLHIQYGNTISHHGKEFRETCKKFGYGKKVFGATYHESMGELITANSHPQNHIIEKIKKLLSLSESSNPHEAQLALSKANTLLQKHQLSPLVTDHSLKKDLYHIKILHEGKRVQTKYQAISEILQHFFIKAIFNHGHQGYRLEIFGKPHHVEIAEYLFHYLDQEIESLWKMNKNKFNLKGLRAKNSFIWGLCEGFIHKLQDSKKSPQTKDLLTMNQALTTSFQSYYKSKKSSQVHAQIDTQSQVVGKKAGLSLSIRKPLDTLKKIKLLR